jgi:hypothetical protein
MSNVKLNLFHAIADFKQFVLANIYKEQFFLIFKSCQDDHNIVIMPLNIIII